MRSVEWNWKDHARAEPFGSPFPPTLLTRTASAIAVAAARSRVGPGRPSTFLLRQPHSGSGAMPHPRATRTRTARSRRFALAVVVRYLSSSRRGRSGSTRLHPQLTPRCRDRRTSSTSKRPNVLHGSRCMADPTTHSSPRIRKSRSWSGMGAWGSKGAYDS